MLHRKIMGLKRTIMFLMTAANLALLACAYALMWNRFFRSAILQPFYRRGNWLIIAIYAALLFGFTKLYGGYRIGFYRVSEILYSQLLSLCFVNVVTYLQISLIDRRLVPAPPFLLLTAAQLALAVVWALAANRIYFMIYPPWRMLLVYAGRQSLDLLPKMNRRGEKFNITQVVRFQRNAEEICELARSFEALVLSGLPTHQRNKILRFCYAQNIRVYIVPTVADLLLSGSEEIHLFDTPLLLLRNRGLNNENKFVKRAFDLAFSTAGILLCAPAMLAVALCVKLGDGGPVLFRQERLTKGGRAFSIYKFRSMVVDAEKDGRARLASQNDGRITPVGRVLRRLRLDELPQLFNIFFGDMSVVGPRPERPEIAERLMRETPEFAFRLKVKAGLTGYAQVLGKYNTSPRDKLLLDLMYIEHYSLLLDLKLILMTIKILFLPESSEGVPDGTPPDGQSGAI